MQQQVDQHRVQNTSDRKKIMVLFQNHSFQTSEYSPAHPHPAISVFFVKGAVHLGQVLNICWKHLDACNQGVSLDNMTI